MKKRVEEIILQIALEVVYLIVNVTSIDTCVKDRGSKTMQNQFQSEDTVSLYWFRPSRVVITIHPILMYYAVV
jgi:hypothetical protein